MPYEEYEDLEDVSADIPSADPSADIPSAHSKPTGDAKPEADPKDVEEIAKGVDPKVGSVLTDETALSALGVLKNILFDLDFSQYQHLM